jgi:alanine dehydrogenase
VLLINEDEVRHLLPMAECLEVMERLFQDAADGGTANMTRHRIPLPKGLHHILGGMSTAFGATGLKTYASGGGGGGAARMVVLLFHIETGEPLAMISADALGQIRTGAASGVATKYMARPEAATVGVIGSGYQAETQLEAICGVRSIRHAWVYSRSAERRNAFAEKMSARLGVTVTGVNTAKAAVSETDVVVTITNSREPLFEGDVLRPGTHINAAGSNHWQRRELDETSVRRSSLVVVDDLPQAKLEAGDLLWAYERRAFRWERAVELRDVVSGRVSGRPADDAITLFESQGIGIEDVAAGMHVYRRAQEQGLGRSLDI